jgi:hypothetical protein
LAATVIGQHDAVDADIDDRAGVVECLNPFDDELAGPLGLDPGQICESLGSNMVSKYSPTGPDQRSSDANANGSVVNKSNHQRGRPSASSTVRNVNAGGIVISLRASRNRAPATGTSTVTSRVSNSASAARRTSAIDRSRSRQCTAETICGPAD